MADNAQRDPIDELAESFVERFRRGERPALSEYIEKCPEQAARIRKLFPTLVMMEELGSEDGEDAQALRRSTKGPERLGDYRILREVGRGGMGLVYEAEQESLGRRVALKILPLHWLVNPQHLKRFRRESRAAARLHHTNIVPVFAVGEHDGIHYYAMQFIQGQGLDDVLSELRGMRGAGKGSGVKSKLSSVRKNGAAAKSSAKPNMQSPPDVHADDVDRGAAAPASPANDLVVPDHSEAEGAKSAARAEESASPQAAPMPGPTGLSSTGSSSEHYFRSIALLGGQVADALGYAHEQGILHRDVKPSNLMLDTDGKVWITDFGLAKTDAQEDLTHTGDLIGTLRYMAPERFQGWSDPRSDVYGLGVTLYEMLTLRPAFEESDRARLIQRIINEEPRAPRRFENAIPVDLETIVLKAIAKEPAERYQSAAELRDDLRRFLESKPIEARRTSIGERARMWCRRNPLVASLAAAITLLLVVGVSAASWAAFHFERVARERQQALEAKEGLVKQLTQAKRVATERLYLTSRFHYERQEHEQAVQGFSALLEAEPNHSDALWWRGHAYGQLDRWQEAIEDLSRFIELNPNLEKGYAARGLWHGRAGNYRRGVEDYRKALESSPNHANYLSNLAWYEAMSPPEDRDLDRALQSALRAVAIAPKSWEHLKTLGIVHYRRKEYDQAIKVLETADRLASHFPFHYYFLAMSHQQRGELDRAIDYYRRADDKRVWGRREPTFRLREQALYEAEADAVITTYLVDQPDQYDLLFRRAELRLRLEKFDDVIRDTTRMIKLRPEEHHGHNLRASALLLLKRDEEAVRDLKQSLALQPGDARTMRELAWVHLMGPEKTRDLTLARELAAKAVQRRRGSPHFLLTLGVADYRLGRYEQAVVYLEKAAASPDDGVHTVRLFFLAMTYHKLDRPTEARETYEEALRRWQVSYCRASDLEAIRDEAKTLVMSESEK